MTTFAMNGYYEDGSTFTGATFEIVVPVGSTQFSHAHDGSFSPDGFPFSNLMTTAMEIRLNGTAVDFSATGPYDLALYEVSWVDDDSIARVSYMLAAFDDGFNNNWFLQLGGDLLPTFDNIADWNAFGDTVTVAPPPSGSGFASGESTPLANLLDVSVSQNDVATGTSGDDVFSLGLGNDIYYGEDGNDTLNGQGNGDDLFGGLGSDTLSGGAGFDDLYGGGGSDVLYGGANNDRIEGGNGNDTIDGVNGSDSINGGNGSDSIRGGNGFDTLFGWDGADVIDGGLGLDQVYGGGGNDTLLGNAGSDELNGGFGHDRLEGQGGNDTLRGDEGNDDLYGGAGNDTLNGDSGDDTLTGDRGADEFFFASVPSFGFGDDIITDFLVNVDVVNFFSNHSIDTFAEWQAASVQVGADVITTSGASSVTFEDVTLGSFDANDFIF